MMPSLLPSAPLPQRQPGPDVLVRVLLGLSHDRRRLVERVLDRLYANADQLYDDLEQALPAQPDTPAVTAARLRQLARHTTPPAPDAEHVREMTGRLREAARRLLPVAVPAGATEAAAHAVEQLLTEAEAPSGLGYLRRLAVALADLLTELEETN
ncbi:hypothetical protein [Streptomyces cacaoi]|uniref:hypothetical protein n=1 Tax=Streptomyces cacaoi TaxID=1898 RepID=UPI0011F1D007|nr:hypothetical protein [Streptomyces cacaoi]